MYRASLKGAGGTGEQCLPGAQAFFYLEGVIRTKLQREFDQKDIVAHIICKRKDRTPRGRRRHGSPQPNSRRAGACLGLLSSVERGLWEKGWKFD